MSSKLQFAEVESLVQNIWENDSDISLRVSRMDRGKVRDQPTKET